MLSAQSPLTKIIFRRCGYTIYIITHGKHIAHLSFSSQRHSLAIDQIRSIDHNCIIRKVTSSDNLICNELEEYLIGNRRHFSFTASPLLLKCASPFRQQIWQQISAIPYGKTATYGNIGREMGNPNLARAVGQAANANPVALIIPCHRVIGKHSLGGYAGGVTIKNYLLDLERDHR